MMEVISHNHCVVIKAQSPDRLPDIESGLRSAIPFHLLVHATCSIAALRVGMKHSG
jgi:hypothetical protein